MPYHTAMREVPANAEQLFTLYDPKTCRVITENDEWTPCLADGCYESRPDADQFKRISVKYTDLRVLSLHELIQRKLDGFSEIQEKYRKLERFGRRDIVIGLPQVAYSVAPKPQCLRCTVDLQIDSIPVIADVVKLKLDWNVTWLKQVVFNAKAWTTQNVNGGYINLWCGHYKGTLLVDDDFNAWLCSAYCVQSYAAEAYESGFISPTKAHIEKRKSRKKASRRQHPLYTRIEKERS